MLIHVIRGEYVFASQFLLFRTISFLFRNLKDCPIGRLQETTVFNERRTNIASAKTEL